MKPQPAARASVASRGPWRAGGSDAPARGDRCRYQCGRASMGGRGWISTGSSSSGPRRLNTCTASWPCASSSRSRSTAGEGCWAALAGRNRNSGVRLSSAASCSRRSAAMSALPSQLSTMLQPPEARHWRVAHRASAGLAGATHSSRSSGTPAAANAGRRAGAAAPPSRASDLQCSDASSAAAGELANAGPGREKLDQRAGGPAATRQHGIERAVTGGVALRGCR